MWREPISQFLSHLWEAKYRRFPVSHRTVLKGALQGVLRLRAQLHNVAPSTLQLRNVNFTESGHQLHNVRALTS